MMLSRCYGHVELLLIQASFKLKAVFYLHPRYYLHLASKIVVYLAA